MVKKAAKKGVLHGIVLHHMEYFSVQGKQEAHSCHLKSSMGPADHL